MYLSAFDLDHTLFNSNSSYRFGRYLYEHRCFSFLTLSFVCCCYFFHAIGWLSSSKLHSYAFWSLFKGKSAPVIQKLVEDFLDANFEHLLYHPALEKLEQAKKAGHLIVILSSSPDILVEPIAKRLNVSKWKSTEYATDCLHDYSHIASLMLGEDKAAYIKKLQESLDIYPQGITAYSDSYLDIPFLLSATQAVGVNPDRKLRALCLKQHWPII